MEDSSVCERLLLAQTQAVWPRLYAKIKERFLEKEILGNGKERQEKSVRAELIRVESRDCVGVRVGTAREIAGAVSVD